MCTFIWVFCGLLCFPVLADAPQLNFYRGFPLPALIFAESTYIPLTLGIAH